jgi:hypothetical protein
MGLGSVFSSLFGKFSRSAKHEEKDTIDSNPQPDTRAIEEGVTQFARSLVRAGYDTRDEIVESIQEYAADEGLEMYDAAKIVGAEIDLLKREQQSWPAFTDYDRLHQAIIKLEENGIVTRENFTCCQTCGHAEIGEEIEKFESKGRKARGYAFFHQQATESVVEGGDINFCYGAEDQTSVVEIAKEVADGMRAAGLKVDWDGTDAMCVMVGLDWKRRWASA